MSLKVKAGLITLLDSHPPIWYHSGVTSNFIQSNSGEESIFMDNILSL